MIAFACFGVALVAAFSATEIVRAAALRLSAVSRPGGRHVHGRVTPRLGGLGIFWGFALALLLATFASAHDARAIADPGLLGLVLGAGVVLLTGLADDVHGLGARPKLLLQACAAALLWAGGWRFEGLTIGPLAWQAGALGLPVTIAWVVLVTNALNLIDGLDGLASGVALVACAAFAWAAGPDGGIVWLGALALAGALVGFLWFNLHPALIFMGDAGSLFVGFTLAALSLRATPAVAGHASPAFAILVLAVPLGDTAFAIVRRARAAARDARGLRAFLREARDRVFTADRGHLHHVLLFTGLSVRRASATLWLASASVACAAAWAARGRAYGAVAAAALVAGWIAFFSRRARRLTRDARPAPAAAADATPGAFAPPAAPEGARPQAETEDEHRVAA